MTRTFDIIVFDDNDIVREKVAGVLSRIGLVGMVGQVSGPAALRKAVARFCPEIILVDLLLAAAESETMAETGKICPGAKLLLYSDGAVECPGFAKKAFAGKVLKTGDIETEVIRILNRSDAEEKATVYEK